MSQFANGSVVGGREKMAGDSLTCTPRRKIRVQFRGYKHTSLTFLVGESSKLRVSSAQKTDPRNVCRNA